MAKGEIKYCELFTGWNETEGYYIMGIIQFKYNPEYKFTDESLRVYYTTTPGQGTALYKDIVPPDSTATGPNILKADSWQVAHTTVANTYHPNTPPQLINIRNKILGLSNDYTVVRFTIPNLSANTTYYTRAWIRLFNNAGTKVKKTYKSPSVEQERLKITTQYGAENQTLFCVPDYQIINSSKNLYTINWVDFTDCIKLPTYDVNSEDINEDWDDANYETHRIVTRKRISGKFEMIFPTMTRYKEFLNYLELSKQLNGSGIAYVELKVHVNNVLDTRADVNIANTRCINYIGKFFIKIDNNAWIQPIFGHYDKYSPLSITIQEA